MQTLFPHDNEKQDPSNDTQPAQPKHEAWDKIKEQIRTLVSDKDFDRWIAPLEIQSSSDNEIIISLPDMMTYQKIMDDFIDQFDFCKATLGLQVFFRFEIQNDDTTANEIFDGDSSSFSDSNEKQSLGFEGKREPDSQPTQQSHHSVDIENSHQDQSQVVSRALTLQSQLNTEYTFTSFVNGPSNQFAHASCLSVADAPGQHYNPLFVYGSTGLGKTHLLHAVGNQVIKDSPNAIITYITSERFMNEMIYCLRFNKMWDFRRKYRNCDVLLVDDIQFISGKERTQEEFFHTFNALYEAKKQIVVTSDIFPQDIPDIEDRLRNRFQWGLIADIQPPDVEHRVAILMNKAEKEGLALGHDVAQYIANHAKGNIRILEGALRRVIAFSNLQGRPINLQLAADTLQSVFGEQNQKDVSVETIQKVVAEHFKIRVVDLKSKKRQRAISAPRQIAMFLARNRTQSSYPEIGACFGGKDHTTVMHAVKKVEKERKKDIDLRTHIETIIRKLDQMV